MDTRVLYFDIDGTLLTESEPKTALADGAFEQAVRAAGFDRLVCVGNVVTTIRFLLGREEPIDGLRMVFERNLEAQHRRAGSTRPSR